MPSTAPSLSSPPCDSGTSPGPASPPRWWLPRRYRLTRSHRHHPRRLTDIQHLQADARAHGWDREAAHHANVTKPSPATCASLWHSCRGVLSRSSGAPASLHGVARGMSHVINGAALDRARSRDIPGLRISCSVNLYGSASHDTSTPIAIKVLTLAPYNHRMSVRAITCQEQCSGKSFRSVGL